MLSGRWCGALTLVLKRRRRSALHHLPDCVQVNGEECGCPDSRRKSPPPEYLRRLLPGMHASRAGRCRRGEGNPPASGRREKELDRWRKEEKEQRRRSATGGPGCSSPEEWEKGREMRWDAPHTESRLPGMYICGLPAKENDEEPTGRRRQQLSAGLIPTLLAFSIFATLRVTNTPFLCEINVDQNSKNKNRTHTPPRSPFLPPSAFPSPGALSLSRAWTPEASWSTRAHWTRHQAGTDTSTQGTSGRSDRSQAQARGM